MEQKLPIIHKRVNFKGASRSRNFGAKQAVSALIAFPDDDCLYPPRLIENITKLFQQKRGIRDYFDGKDRTIRDQ